MLGPYNQTASSRDSDGKLSEIHLTQTWILWLELSLTGLVSLVLILFKAYLGLPLVFLWASTLLLRQYRLKIEDLTISNQHRQIIWRDTQGLIGRLNYEEVTAFTLYRIKIAYNRRTRFPQDLLSLVLKNGQELEILRLPPEESGSYKKQWQELEFNPKDLIRQPTSEQTEQLPHWLRYRQTASGHDRYSWHKRQSHVSCLSWIGGWIWAGFLAWKDTEGWFILQPYAWLLWGIAVLVTGLTLLKMGRQYWLEIGPQNVIWGISDFSGKTYPKGTLAREHELIFYWQCGDERKRNAQTEDRDYRNYQMADDYRLYGMSHARIHILKNAGAAEITRKKEINQDLSIQHLLNYVASKNRLTLPLPGFNIAETVFLLGLIRQRIEKEPNENLVQK